MGLEDFLNPDDPDSRWIGFDLGFELYQLERKDFLGVLAAFREFVDRNGESWPFAQGGGSVRTPPAAYEMVEKLIKVWGPPWPIEGLFDACGGPEGCRQVDLAAAWDDVAFFAKVSTLISSSQHVAREEKLKVYRMLMAKRHELDQEFITQLKAVRERGVLNLRAEARSFRAWLFDYLVRNFDSHDGAVCVVCHKWFPIEADHVGRRPEYCQGCEGGTTRKRMYRPPKKGGLRRPCQHGCAFVDAARLLSSLYHSGVVAFDRAQFNEEFERTLKAGKRARLKPFDELSGRLATR